MIQTTNNKRSFQILIQWTTNQIIQESISKGQKMLYRNNKEHLIVHRYLQVLNC